MNSETLKLLLVAGARPNFMKIAPVVKAAVAHNTARSDGDPRLDFRIVHTGQHYDQKMSDVFFTELRIPPPDINLGVGSASHAVQTANIMAKFEPVCLKERPDWVIVVGDVNSTMACTLVCSKLGIKVAHVEAGLRSFDRSMPEEINRLVTDALADLFLTPSADADHNLAREGVPASKIRLVGNVMIDALISNLGKARSSPVLSRLGINRKDFVYVTLHRPSNVDEEKPLRAILLELTRLAHKLPVIFPMHPRTRKMCEQFDIDLKGHPGLIILEPIGYHDSLCLAENARLVLTDSGGLQEETTYFRTPCLTLRPNTERPITVTVGSNKLTSVSHLAADLRDVLDRETAFGEIPPLWDGRTAGRIIKCLIDHEDVAAQPASHPSFRQGAPLVASGHSV